VVNEVRKLAEKSALAVKEIARPIRNVPISADRVEKAVDEILICEP
jgi:methyl-accepting chemotaxis protein